MGSIERSALLVVGIYINLHWCRRRRNRLGVGRSLRHLSHHSAHDPAHAEAHADTKAGTHHLSCGSFVACCFLHHVELTFLLVAVSLALTLSGEGAALQIHSPSLCLSGKYFLVVRVALDGIHALHVELGELGPVVFKIFIDFLLGEAGQFRKVVVHVCDAGLSLTEKFAQGWHHPLAHGRLELFGEAVQVDFMFRAAIFTDECDCIHDSEFVASIGSHFDRDALVAQGEIPYGKADAPASVIASEALTLSAYAEDCCLEGCFPSERNVHYLLQEWDVVGSQGVASWEKGVGVHALRHEHHLLAFLYGDSRSSAEVVIRIALQEAAFFLVDEYIVDEAGAFIALSIEGLSL